MDADGQGRSEAAATLAEQLNRSVDVSVSPLRRGRFRRALDRARYAQDVVGVSVDDPVGRFHLLVPDGPGLSVGRLTDVVAVVSGLRRRFPWAAVQLVSFDDVAALSRRPSVAGFVTTPVLREIHVDRGLVTGGGSATPRVIEVVTHEVWHVVEDVFEATRYRDSIELRMALGRLLGLATFEHAYRAGPHAGAEAQASALDRIRAAVGEYATTSPSEGTAELFTAWWVGTGSDELVAAFGDLVDRYLPVRPRRVD